MEDSFLSAAWVLPVVQAPIADGAVIVRDGRIDAVGPAAELSPQAGGLRKLELGPTALLPGLVNVHAHLELTALRGYLESLDFFAWIRRLTQTKYERMSEDELRVSTCWGVAEMTRAGVTTVGDVCDVGVSPQALSEGGLRAIVFQEAFGPDPADVARSVARLEERLVSHEAFLDDRVRLGVSPHAPYSVSPALFQRVTELALEREYPMTVHAAESPAEVEFVRDGTGPFADYLRGRDIEVVPIGKSTIRHLDDLGVLRGQPLLVHGVFCDDDDLERIRASGSKIAHCPKSNAKLAHGVAPWREMRNLGVSVGLGSDGVICNNSIDLFEEVRVAALFDRARISAVQPTSSPSARDLVRMLTLDGARAMGLEDTTGSLEKGKAADLCAVDLSTFGSEPVHDVETALIWSASARDVTMTMVDGEILYRRGADGSDELTRWDLAELRREIGQIPTSLRDPGA